jgi:hypothetical protein
LSTLLTEAQILPTSSPPVTSAEENRFCVLL